MRGVCMKRRLAHAAMARAIHDYVSLNGQQEPFVKAFLQYTWSHSDGDKILSAAKGENVLV